MEDFMRAWNFILENWGEETVYELLEEDDPGFDVRFFEGEGSEEDIPYIIDGFMSFIIDTLAPINPENAHELLADMGIPDEDIEAMLS